MNKEKEKKGEQLFKVVFTILVQADTTEDALVKGKFAVQNGYESEVLIEHL